MDRKDVIRHMTADLCTAMACKTSIAAVDVNILSEAISLLEEQEAVEPKHNPLSPTDWFCGKCGMCISRFHDYCPSCGKPVKWE